MFLKSIRTVTGKRKICLFFWACCFFLLSDFAWNEEISSRTPAINLDKSLLSLNPGQTGPKLVILPRGSLSIIEEEENEEYHGVGLNAGLRFSF